MLNVARDSVSDRFNHHAALSREAHSCTRNDGETLKSFIERLLNPAASYLIMTQADESSAENQNFAVAMISNAKLPSQIYTTVMSNLVSKGKDKAGEGMPTSTVQRTRVLQAVSGLQKMTKIVADIEDAIALDATASAPESGTARPAGQHALANLRLNLQVYKKSAAEVESTSAVLMLFAVALAATDGEEESQHAVSLADAVLALEKVNLLLEDVGTPNTAAVMLAHMKLANRFNSDGRGCGRGGGNWKGSSRRGDRRN